MTNYLLLTPYTLHQVVYIITPKKTSLHESKKMLFLKDNFLFSSPTDTWYGIQALREAPFSSTRGATYGGNRGGGGYGKTYIEVIN